MMTVLMKLFCWDRGKNDFINTPHNERQKTSLRNLLMKKCEKAQNKSTDSSKMTEMILI